MNLPAPEIDLREITDTDLESVADLLACGFPNRTRQFWRHAMDQLHRRRPPSGFPRYGYVMEQHGAEVGVILTIYSTTRAGDRVATRCNPCAWYVEAPFRAYAGLFLAHTLGREDVTYLDVTPAPHTRRMIEALGFVRYCEGVFICMPMLNISCAEGRVDVFEAVGHQLSAVFDPFERELLLDHAECGCLSLWCRTSERAYPFVFRRRRLKGFVPVAQMIYCPAVDDFVRLAGPIGRFLARRGILLVVVDANGPMPELIGKFFDAPKYFKGPERPRLGDLAYTEFGVLGV